MRSRIRFAYVLPVVHSCFVAAICASNLNDLISKAGIVDFPLTILASPILMNVDLAPVWVVLYYGLCGGLLWYGVGRLVDRVIT